VDFQIPVARSNKLDYFTHITRTASQIKNIASTGSHQSEEQLHPSWAAKRKQSGTLSSIETNFIRAKKIKFDDDGSVPEAMSTKGIHEAKRMPDPRIPTGKPALRGKSGVDAKPLHPSWEAHKKSKAAAAAAASVPAVPTGTKTVFAD